MERQKLDQHDSTILLITKHWEHKDIPKGEEETIKHYAKRIFAHFIGVKSQHVAIPFVWLDLVETICTKKEMMTIMKRACTRDLVEVIIGVLSTMKIKRFELDASLISDLPGRIDQAFAARRLKLIN